MTKLELGIRQLAEVIGGRFEFEVDDYERFKFKADMDGKQVSRLPDGSLAFVVVLDGVSILVRHKPVLQVMDGGAA